MTYTAPTISGYNSTPPTDDGAATEANSVKWATIKNKIGDPLKDYIDNVSGAVDDAFTQLFLGDFEAKSADFTVGLTDDGKLFDCTSAITITFPAAATAGEGFKFAVFNNVAAGGAITCDGNSSETINNALTHSTPARYDVTIYVCTGAAWRALFIKGSEGSSAERTVASATTCDIAATTGNNVVISGVTTITSFGSSASTTLPIYYVRFTGAMILTYNATSLITPSGANITTRDGDYATLLYLGSGNWRILSYYGLATTAQAQVGTDPNMFLTPLTGLSLVAQNSPVRKRSVASTATYSNTSSVIPIDASIPQNTEGAEILTLSYAPVAADSILKVRAYIPMLDVSSGNRAIAALFKDTTSNAVSAACTYPTGGGGADTLEVLYEEVAGSISARTYKLRAGCNAGTLHLLGDSLLAAAAFGGIMKIYLEVTEYKP